MSMNDDLRGWCDDRRRRKAADRWREDFQLAIDLDVPNPVEWASLASLVTKEGHDLSIAQALSRYESARGDDPRR